MTKTDLWRLGFTGSTLDAILDSGWVKDQVGTNPTVVVSMAGSGKDIAHLAQQGRTIYSWDTQELSRCVVEGVFAAPAAPEQPLARGELVGYASTQGGMTGMPQDAARLVDYLATAGSDYDRVCLAQALIRHSFMGRLAAWGTVPPGDTDTLYAAYLKNHAKFAYWRGLPGEFHHVKGSVFADPAFPDKTRGAVLYIDTPKVLTGSKKGGDIYSKGWRGLNSILAQAHQELPPWTEDTFRRDMPKLWCAPYQRMVLFHATECLPEPQDVLKAMLGDGLAPPTSVGSWVHKGRTDVAWVMDR